MEKSQLRLRITSRRDGDVVYRRRYLLRMEIVWTKFPAVDSWETLVVPVLAHSQLMFYLVCSGCGEKRPYVRQHVSLSF